MSASFQASLFGDCTAAAQPGPRPLADGLSRTDLGSGAWIDLRPGWIRGADELFADLLGSVPWESERLRMYERVVDVPRLASRYERCAPLPHPVVQRIKDDLDRHYTPEFGDGFAGAGLALYRDGQDSVAWHGDVFGRERDTDTMVAIVVLGPPRPFLLRPRHRPRAAGPDPAPRTRPRRSDRHGRELPAHLAALCAEVGPGRRPADQRPVQDQRMSARAAGARAHRGPVRSMLISTMNDLPGYAVVEVHGEVFGLTVRSRHIGSTVGAIFKSVVGGELRGMTKMLVDGRQSATERLVAEAQSKGANAVLAFRFDTSELGSTWTEICAYGTAVVVRTTSP